MNIDKIKQIGKIGEKYIALVGIHILAFQYDGEWLKICFGADLVLLGIAFTNGKEKLSQKK